MGAGRQFGHDAAERARARRSGCGRCWRAMRPRPSASRATTAAAVSSQLVSMPRMTFRCACPVTAKGLWPCLLETRVLAYRDKQAPLQSSAKPPPDHRHARFAAGTRPGASGPRPASCAAHGLDEAAIVIIAGHHLRRPLAGEQSALERFRRQGPFFQGNRGSAGRRRRSISASIRPRTWRPSCRTGSTCRSFSNARTCATPSSASRSARSTICRRGRWSAPRRSGGGPSS